MNDRSRLGYRYEDLFVGMRFRSPGRTILDADLIGFAGLTGDYSELQRLQEILPMTAIATAPRPFDPNDLNGKGLGAKLTRAALDCLSARYAQLVAAPGKFEIASDLFAVRGFLRVKGPDGCPDRLVWSQPSELFRVAAWWDGDGPVTKISLPDLSQLGKLKPNVTFEMPPFLANLLQGDMKKLSDGEGSEPSKIGLGWLCSFSLPIITLCAFIVLNIFLTLFDIFLRWMLFIKICIPIPKKE